MAIGNNTSPAFRQVPARDRRRYPALSFIFLAGFSMAVFLCGCSSTRAPVVSRDSGDLGRASVSSSGQAGQQSRPGFYEVQKGDTLYSIAWRYGLDYRTLAEWNDIRDPYVIYPGQDIRLSPGARRKSTTAAGAQGRSSRTVRTETSSPSPSSKSGTNKQSAGTDASINWQWPTPGKVVNPDTPIAKKGVNIAGRKGQHIKAAADGRVVYSGSGLLGYGKLIIIKHSDVYLSAYAHNDKIYVKEGDRVAVGQKIATMGLGNNGKPVLHFEIRKDGKPVSPLYHLPENRS